VAAIESVTAASNTHTMFTAKNSDYLYIQNCYLTVEEVGKMPKQLHINSVSRILSTTVSEACQEEVCL